MPHDNKNSQANSTTTIPCALRGLGLVVAYKYKIVFQSITIINYKTSFMNIADFKNAKELGKYINTVGNSKELWEIFWFRKIKIVYTSIVNTLI